MRGLIAIIFKLNHGHGRLSKAGLTLIELLLTMTIIVVLTGLVSLSLVRLSDTTNLESASSQVVSATRDAQNRAQAGQDGSKWGVHFESGSFALFKGDSWAGGGSTTAAGKTTLPGGMSFQEVNITGCGTTLPCDVVFAFDGSTANYGGGASNAALAIVSAGFKVYIYIGPNGFIDQSDVTPTTGGSPPPPPPPPGLPPGWTKVDLDSPGGPAYNMESLAMALDSDGYARVSYVDIPNTGTGNLKYIRCKSTDCGSKSTPVTLVTSAAACCTYTSIALGDDGQARITYTEGGGAGTIHLVRCTSADLDCTTRVDTSISVGGIAKDHHLKLINTGDAATDNDYARITFFDANASGSPSTPKTDLRYVQCPETAGNLDCTGSPAVRTIDNTGDGTAKVGAFYNRQKLSGSASFIAYPFDNGSTRKIEFLRCTNSACSTTVPSDPVGSPNVIASSASFIGYPSIDLGSDGFGRISWYDGTSPYGLKFVKCTNNIDCTSNGGVKTVDSGGRNRFTSLALTSSNLVRIASYAMNFSGAAYSGLRYAECDADCSSPAVTTVDADAVADGTFVNYTALGLYNDKPRIVYYDAEERKLKVALCDTACT